MISLVNNNGYKWTFTANVYFRGYFIIKDDNSLHVYCNEDACKKIEPLSSFKDFIEFLKKIEGCFSIVVEKEKTVWISTDRARSMPIYYSTDGKIISDSAENIRQYLAINKENVDRESLVELYANYYLFGHKTIYSEIKQLDLCEAAELSNIDINIIRYYEHISQIKLSDISELRKCIETASKHAFERIKVAIGNRPVVLSMSGGYDSRFVGCMLKNAGVKDVSCYTYGKASSFEVAQSKKNAEALGFRWTCVEMTDDLVSRNLDEIGQAYFNSYTGHDFTAYMQNFTAVRKLHEDGWFKPNSVFLTGLCGDMPTGEYALPFSSSKEYSLNTAADALYSLIFTRYDLEDYHKKKWIESIKKRLNELPIDICDYHSWHQAIDCIYTSSCHIHWYMHMNSVHSFFGYEWLLPYWDEELLMSWYAVPTEYKVKQKLYEDWLMEVVCKPYGLSQNKIIGGYVKKGWKRTAQYYVGGVLNYCMLHLGMPFKRKGDFSNFAPLELELFKNIKTRDCINYRRAGMMQLLENYLIEQRYGADNLRYACKHVKSRL